MPPGNYRFRVTAHGGNGVWSEADGSVALVVPRRYWQTWWFRLAVLAGFTVSVAAIVRYVSFRRLRRQVRLLEQHAALQRERARIAKDIHDDVGADLTQIALLGELARQDQPAAGQGRRTHRHHLGHCPADHQVARRDRLGRQPAQRHALPPGRVYRAVRARLPAAGRHPLSPGFPRQYARARTLHRVAP